MAKKKNEEKLKKIEEERRKRNFEKSKSKKEKKKKRKTEKRIKKQSKRELRKLRIKIIKKRVGKGKYKRTGIKEKKGKPIQIKNVVGRGIGRITINNVLTRSEQDLGESYDKLFSNLVKDDELRKILIHPENLQKLETWRFECRIKTYGMDNELLSESVKSGASLYEAKGISKTLLYRGRNLGKYQGELTEALKDRKWTISYANEGNIERVQVELIFRKA